MTEELGVQTVSDSVMSIEQSRAIQEVQASLVIAKKFPRDQDAAYLRIMKACERYSLADQAEYAYPRGGQTVSGTSIRLTEVIAQNWGNLNFGIRELSQANGESEVEAFAWDLETNVKQVKTFTVKHKRYTKAKGNVALTDPRDIYEMTANQGARRMRSCILGVIPGDIIEKAVEQCRATVKKGIKEKPIKDQIRSTLKAFDSLGITKDLIEDRLGHSTDTIIEEELIDLNNIGRSIKDNMTSREEWFNVKGEQQKKAADLTDKIKGETSAQDLKAKLDEEDKQVEGFRRLKGEKDPEKWVAEEENDPNTEEAPKEADPLYALSMRRPGSSVPANKDFIEDYDKQDSEIAMLEDKDMRSRIDAKYKKAKAVVAAAAPTPASGDKSPERMEWEKAMLKYSTDHEDEFDKILWDKMGVRSMGQITQKADEDLALGYLAEKFGG